MEDNKTKVIGKKIQEVSLREEVTQALNATILNDEKIELNTGMNGAATFKTEPFRGKLDSVIIDVGGMITGIDIMIESSLGYLILQRKQVKGINYFAPRIRTTTPLPDLRDVPLHDKFNLNESILITVMGPKNTDVTIILRPA